MKIIGFDDFVKKTNSKCSVHFWKLIIKIFGNDNSKVKIISFDHFIRKLNSKYPVHVWKLISENIQKCHKR